MSSNQELLPDMTEDTSVPTLSNRFRLLVLPRGLQRIVPTQSYRTRGSLAGRDVGILKGFVDLPMDIAFETAMYLGPKDLLQLSRLSKQFRSIFASRSAIFVWRTSFRNLNLKCLPDLNELQFASLIYDKHCMACGRMTRCQLFPMLRLRLCPSCQMANLVYIKDLENQYQNAKELIHYLPDSLGRCFKPEAEILIDKFLSLKNENSLKFIDNLGQHTRDKREANAPMVSFIYPTKARSCRTKWSCAGYGARRW